MLAAAVRRVARLLWIGVFLAVALAAGHLALIEMGREVVVLHTRAPDGVWNQARLWVVDHEGRAWLHGNLGSRWMDGLHADPHVRLERGGETRDYVASPVSGPHPSIDRLLRDKYGIADWWVRVLAPDGDATRAVRLEPAPGS